MRDGRVAAGAAWRAERGADRIPERLVRAELHDACGQALFERYQRSEKSGVDRDVRTGRVNAESEAITEELCGHAFSASSISEITKRLDEQLEAFATRRLEEDYPYLIVDTRYERIRVDGAIRSQAVLIAIGINWDGRRCILGVEVAERKAPVMPEAPWQRCYVHFLRNALDHLPRRRDDDCLRELRLIYDRRDAAEARA
jgi:putative transposase